MGQIDRSSFPVRSLRRLSDLRVRRGSAENVETRSVRLLVNIFFGKSATFDTSNDGPQFAINLCQHSSEFLLRTGHEVRDVRFLASVWRVRGEIVIRDTFS